MLGVPFWKFIAIEIQMLIGTYGYFKVFLGIVTGPESIKILVWTNINSQYKCLGGLKVYRNGHVIMKYCTRIKKKFGVFFFSGLFMFVIS